MIKSILPFLVIFFAGVAIAHAANGPITVSLAKKHVDITAGFNGAELALFGVHDGVGNIAVTIQGPLKTMNVRRKEKVGVVWMNRQSAQFENVPGFFDYALSNDDTELPLADLLFSSKDNLPENEATSFQRALRRNKQERGLFAKEPKQVEFISDGFFRTTFKLPPHVPTGEYIITTFLFTPQGHALDTYTTTLKVEQVGVSAAVNSFAHKHAALYGLLCVIFAMSIGWLSNVVRNRLR